LDKRIAERAMFLQNHLTVRRARPEVPIWRGLRHLQGDILCVRSVRGGQTQIGSYVRLIVEREGALVAFASVPEWHLRDAARLGVARLLGRALEDTSSCIGTWVFVIVQIRDGDRVYVPTWRVIDLEISSRSSAQRWCRPRRSSGGRTPPSPPRTPAPLRAPAPASVRSPGARRQRYIGPRSLPSRPPTTTAASCPQLLWAGPR